MVNHFASLLLNLNLFNVELLNQNYLLATETDKKIAVENLGGIYDVALNDYYTEVVKLTQPTFFTNKNYIKLNLPEELQKFYNILFPEEYSFFDKTFLLYSYLRLIASTSLSEEVKVYDSRVTYDLNLVQEYFKFFKIFTPRSNNNNYSLLLAGKPHNLSLNDTFLIRQIDDSNNLSVYSTAEKKYIKNNRIPSTSLEDMYISIQNTSASITQSIAVGDTGLSVRLSGDLPDFTATSNKFWTFTVQSPLSFDFPHKFKECFDSLNWVEPMLTFKQSAANVNYERVWREHHNSVYRFTGLLLAYVQRVHFLWQEISQA